MKQCNLTKGLVVFLTITITFFFGLMPSAWANGEPSCAQSDFQGFFAFTESGTVRMVMGGGVITSLLPIASAGWIDVQWNGADTGTISGIEMVNMGGVPFQAGIAGTFDTSSDGDNSNCTGIATVTVTPTPIHPLFPPVYTTFSFVINSNGKQSEIRTLTTEMIPTAFPAPGLPVFVPLAITGVAKPQS